MHHECFAHLQRAAEEQECARLGHPIGSQRCWTGSNGDIAAGEVGTVVGLAATEKGKIVVEFGKGSWMFSSDQLISVDEHGRRAAVAAERCRAAEARAAQAAAVEAERRAREAAALRAREAEAEQRRARIIAEWAREAAARRAREAEAEQRRAREAAARHQGGAAEEPHDAAAMRRQNEVKFNPPPSRKTSSTLCIPS